MVKSYNLLVVSFDGQTQLERVNGTITDCWDRSNDMGSRWYFYPFHFVVSDKTVIGTPEELSRYQGKRIKTLLKDFKAAYNKSISDNVQVDCFEFVEQYL